MTSVYFLLALCSITAIGAQELIDTFERPILNRDYRNHDLIVNTSSSDPGIHVENATACGKLCDSIITPKPCLGFVYYTQTYTGTIDNVHNRTIHAKTCFPKSSLELSIDRDGAFSLYSYKSAIRSAAPALKYPIALLWLAVSVSVAKPLYC